LEIETTNNIVKCVRLREVR